MSRDFFRVEKGLHITDENGDTGWHLLHGSGVPGSLSQENDAEVGSIYARTNGSFYQKRTAGSGTDKWERLPFVSEVAIGVWRGEHVVACTDDNAPGSLPAQIDLDTTPPGFTDDDTPYLGTSDFSVGDFIIFDADGGGTGCVLLEVTAVSAPNITVDTPSTAPVLSTNDGFICTNYLPDSPGDQEARALVVYNGTGMVKLGDVNWDIATGINLSSGYAAASGNVTSSDTVESALQKLDGNIDAIDTRQGLTQGAVNFGSFTGGQNVLPNNSTTKAILQAIADEIDTYKTQTGVTTTVTLDSVAIADYEAVEWLVHAELDSASTSRKVGRILALHDGSSVTVDAVDLVKTASFNTTYSVDISGGEMRLRVGASSAVTFKSHRRHVIASIN